MKQKPVYLWPTEAIPPDGRPYVNVGSSLFVSAIFLTSIFLFWYCLVAGLSFYITWHDFPGFAKPTGWHGTSITFHALNYFLNALGDIAHMLKIGRKLPLISYRNYNEYIQYLAKLDKADLLLIRWNIATLSGFAVGLYRATRAYKSIKNFWRPIQNYTQVDGFVLLDGDDAVQGLQRFLAYARFETIGARLAKTLLSYFELPVFSVLHRRMVSLLLALNISTESEYKKNMIFATVQQRNIYDPKNTYVDEDYIYMSSDLRKRHFLIIGNTGGGKGVFLSQQVQQIKEKIEAGYNYWAVFWDTPKNEFSKQLPESMCHIIAPQDKGSMPHDLARDLPLKQHIVQFWAARIPKNDKDEFWSNASRGVGAGICVFLNETCGNAWSYNNLAYWKDKGASVIKPIMEEYYPEMNNIMDLGQQTLGSVMGNFAGFTLDINDLAEIWDGFSYKKAIHQMSVALLRTPYWKDFFLDNCFPMTEEVAKGEEILTQTITENIPSNKLMNGLIDYLNSKKKWRWVNLKEILNSPMKKQIAVAKRFVDIDEEDFNVTKYKAHMRLIKPILQYAEIWDSFEKKKRFSVREWLRSEKPSKRIFIIRPSTEFSEQLIGTTKGILSTIVSIINSPTYTEDKDLKIKRHFHIVLDEFDSLGNIDYFIKPAIALVRSKGVSLWLACQDMAQLVNTYGKDLTDFFVSNIGNKIFIGIAPGASADNISSLFGEKKINKMHISTTSQADGKSSSINYQEHQDKVITPAMLNSELGTKNGVTTYLYMPSGSNEVFILKTTVCDLPCYPKSGPADWTEGIKFKPAPTDDGKFLKDVFGVLPPNPEDPPPPPELPPPLPGAQMAPAVQVFTPADLMTASTSDEEADFDYDDLESLFQGEGDPEPIHAKDSDRLERQRIYTMPKEAEELESELMKELAIETVLHHSPLHMLKSYADIQEAASTTKTNSKAKFLKAVKDIKDKDKHIGLDMDTRP